MADRIDLSPGLIALIKISCTSTGQSENQDVSLDNSQNNESIASSFGPNIATLKALANNQINAYQYTSVPVQYLQILSEACCLLSISLVENWFRFNNHRQASFPFDAIIREIDTGLIIGGSAVRHSLRQLINKFYNVLAEYETITVVQKRKNIFSEFMCSQSDLKICESMRAYLDPSCLVDVIQGPEIDNASKLLSTSQSNHLINNGFSSFLEPKCIRSIASSWPASESWNRVGYLMEATSNGRRIVPVEIGSSYVSEAWTQKFVSFGDLLSECLLLPRFEDRPAKSYLAQYDLFLQINSLRKDILVPNLIHFPEISTKDSVTINAWIGPRGTISPLHTDPYNNVLVQVVGCKYLRLYNPSATMYPREPENGIDMSNTSTVELEKGCVEKYFDEDFSPSKSAWIDGDEMTTDLFAQLRHASRMKREYRDQFPEFQWESGFLECILSPGDGLFIPVGFLSFLYHLCSSVKAGWWHYVKSLTPSASVNFWF
ncbi:uncharacterized protein V1516DRAFT_664046 [Lipomyces oligophaga]|uniref:uncharacterized protein n=1 Tax=Lipomyces oligophaga TaxID=45792 RepID=UPI0034CEDCB9